MRQQEANCRMLRNARSVVPEGPDESSPAILLLGKESEGSRPVRDDRTLTTDLGLNVTLCRPDGGCRTLHDGRTIGYRSGEARQAVLGTRVLLEQFSRTASTEQSIISNPKLASSRLGARSFAYLPCVVSPAKKRSSSFRVGNPA